MKNISAFFSKLFPRKLEKPRVPLIRGQGDYTLMPGASGKNISVYEIKPYPASIGFLTKKFNLNPGSQNWFEVISGANTRTLKKITEEFHEEADAQTFPHNDLKTWDKIFAEYRKNVMRTKIIDKYKNYRRAKDEEIIEDRDLDSSAVRDILGIFAKKEFVGHKGWLGRTYYTGRVAFAPLPDGSNAFAREILNPDTLNGKKVVARSWQGGNTDPFELPFSFDVLSKYGQATIEE
jgi:hypothetical protein